MGGEDFPNKNEEISQKFEKLRTRAVQEIVDNLMMSGETSIDAARVTAVDIFDSRYGNAIFLYGTLMEANESEPSSTEEARLGDARSTIEELEATFAEGGYMSQIIAKRLAALLPDMADLESRSWHS